ncbi:HDOD domain-containing protein [Actinotalea sp. K2]|uniref:EAL and HDOD domain-containing protein n=1 Tax=Actinotalea sp. K2 TaxID=2939438 RepID=UPI0020171875|nr:EAL domain-containing protein [Actinotalea sp. K2]MCL3859782.1 EAL domain-containing protein [Actinotalea sp. K2]
MDLTAVTPQPTAGWVHVARQPIYDRSLTVRGHELLFRAHSTSTGAGPDAGDLATTTVVLNTFTAFGLDQLVGGGLAFVNLTRPFVVGELPIPFDPHAVVLELVEGVVVDEAVREGVQRLRAEGFDLALDDFLWDQTDRVALMPDITYVKVDISQLSASALATTVLQLRAHDVLLVAERVETAADLEMCRTLGFDLFQGYHLLRPETLSAVTLTPDRLACLGLLHRLSDPSLTLEDIEDLVHRDAGLTYRVLHAANTAATGLRRKLGSVHDALVMLGTERLRAWVMLLASADAGGGDQEQLAAAVVRARTCELLADRLDLHPGAAFTAGLLSRLDIVLGVPLHAILENLSLSDELHAALIDSTGPLGELLAAVIAYERGVPPEAEPLSTELAEAYLVAIAWATATLANLPPAPASSGA